MIVRLEAEGLDDLRASMARMDAPAKQRVRAALEAWAEAVLAQARPNVPVDDVDGGQLRDSGRVIRATVSHTRVSVGVAFGGAALEPYLGRRKANVYAVIQHEDLTLRHNDGMAKYLERPFMAALPRVPDVIIAAIDGATGEAA